MPFKRAYSTLLIAFLLATSLRQSGIMSVRSMPSAQVLINEFEQDPLGEPDIEKQWIELINKETSEVDLSGWRIVTYDFITSSIRNVFQIRPGTRIDPKGYRVIGYDDTSPRPILQALSDKQDLATDNQSP